MARAITELGPRLRHRIDIEVAVESASSRGAQSESWQTIRSSDETDLIPAEIVPVSARELLAADALAAGVTTKITIRWRPDVTVDAVTMRVTHDGLVYNIRGVLPDNSLRRWLVLLCETGVKRAG